MYKNLIDDFLSKYNIKPKNYNLYLEALTHNSYANEQKLKYSYQRLEFLGDSVLQMYISKFLFLNYYKLSEGILTKHRANIVREETLYEVTKKIDLVSLIRLGKGEIQTNGLQKKSILSDIFESFTAAIYLDQGESKTISWLEQTLIKFSIDGDFLNWNKDYKSSLQIILQSEKRSDLKYVVINEKFIKEENKFIYEISVNLENNILGTGIGSSKQEAEQNAAKDALSKMCAL